MLLDRNLYLTSAATTGTKYNRLLTEMAFITWYPSEYSTAEKHYCNCFKSKGIAKSTLFQILLYWPDDKSLAFWANLHGSRPQSPAGKNIAEFLLSPLYDLNILKKILNRPCGQMPWLRGIGAFRKGHTNILQIFVEQGLSAYLAVLHNEYCTAVLHCTQSVGDGDAGSALLSTIQGAQNTSFALCVQSWGGLVE